MQHPARLSFGGVTLDTTRGVLAAPDGTETALRPKTLELALLLLRNPGRVVSRAEILDTVWPGVFVTDDSVTQCVVELRRAMGADAAALKTVPRRGYLLEAEVEVSLATPPRLLVKPDAPAAEQPARPGVPSAIAPPPNATLPAGPLRRWGPGLAALAAGLGLMAWLAVPGAPPPIPAPVAAHIAMPVPEPAPASLPAPLPAPLAAAAPAAEAPPPAQPSAREQAIELIEAARRRNIAPGDRRANWVAARSLLAQALTLDPENARAHAEIVFTYTNTVLNGFSLNPAADLRIAEDHAERAIALGPNLPATHAAHAAVMRQQRRWEDALASYRRGVALDPTQHASRANAGLMLLLLGQPEEAEAPIRTTLALAPPSHGFRLTWLTYLALTLAHQQRWAEAAETLRASLDGQAFLPVPVRLAYLAAMLELSGDAEAARIAAAQAMAQNPELGIGWFRTRALSDHPGFAARQEALLTAMRSAGLAE